jgi:hypothetical protein
MAEKNDNPKPATPANEGLEMKPDKDSSEELKKASQIKNDAGPDTAPDEHISPKADTDVPIDGQILNDAVLRGEPHDESNINWPDEDKE